MIQLYTLWMHYYRYYVHTVYSCRTASTVLQRWTKTLLAKAPRHSCTAVQLYENSCSADAAESTRDKLSRRMSARIA
eukprot:SAG25_NODE_215_length_11684_cov_261.443677_6_plen_77_part_00